MDGFFGSEKIIELGIFMSLQMFDIPEGWRWYGLFSEWEVHYILLGESVLEQKQSSDFFGGVLKPRWCVGGESCLAEAFWFSFL